MALAGTSPTISWHIERTLLNVRASANVRKSTSSCSRNALSRARESEERATDLSVCTPLCAPQEVARTLSASPPTIQRAGAREIRARTPRGTSGRAFLGGESPSPAARERGSGGPRRADLNQNHAVPRLSSRVKYIPYHVVVVCGSRMRRRTHARTVARTRTRARATSSLVCRCSVPSCCARAWGACLGHFPGLHPPLCGSVRTWRR